MTSSLLRLHLRHTYLNTRPPPLPLFRRSCALSGLLWCLFMYFVKLRMRSFLIGFFIFHAPRMPLTPFVKCLRALSRACHNKSRSIARVSSLYQFLARHVATRCTISSNRPALVSSLNTVLEWTIYIYCRLSARCSFTRLSWVYMVSLLSRVSLCARRIVYIRARRRVGKSDQSSGRILNAKHYALLS